MLAFPLQFGFNLLPNGARFGISHFVCVSVTQGDAYLFRSWKEPPVLLMLRVGSFRVCRHDLLAATRFWCLFDLVFLYEQLLASNLGTMVGKQVPSDCVSLYCSTK
jgi:hypothetical protein